MRQLFVIAVLSAIAAAMTAVPAQADSISSVEGARAKERSGQYLTRQDRERLRRYGSNDDGFNSYGRGGTYSYDGDGPYGYGPRYGYGPGYGDGGGRSGGFSIELY
jgi:hypothetical protein